MSAHSKRRNIASAGAFCLLALAGFSEIVHPWVPMWLALLLLGVTVAAFVVGERST